MSETRPIRAFSKKKRVNTVGHRCMIAHLPSSLRPDDVEREYKGAGTLVTKPNIGPLSELVEQSQSLAKRVGSEIMVRKCKLPFHRVKAYSATTNGNRLLHRS
jgi:hypothetical protein